MKRQDARPARSEFLEPEASLDRLASAVLGAAVEVHKSLGPGLLESVYEHAVCVELSLRGVTFRRQVSVAFEYKGHPVGEGRLDLLVDERLIVELKAVESLEPIHRVQVHTYLMATGLCLGLLINFNVPLLLRGVQRVVLTSNARKSEAASEQTLSDPGGPGVLALK